MPSPEVHGDAINGRCQGLYLMRAEDRIGHAFAGEATKLYHMMGAETAWTDVSGASYACPAPGDGFWSMTSFGKRIIATDYADPIQSCLLGVDSTFSDLSVDAPKARYAEVIRDFVMVGNTNDPVDGARPSRVWWSAIGNPPDWPTPGTDAAVQVQSDYQDLQQSDLGEVTGIVGGLAGADGLVFCERGIYRVVYQGSPTIFGFSVAEGASGTRAPQSIIKRHLRTKDAVVAVAAYLGEDGFYANDGTTSIPIGSERVNRWFFDNLAVNAQIYVIGATDPSRQINVWAFPSKDAPEGMLDRLIINNWNIGRWSYCDLSASPLEMFGRSMLMGYTIDQIDDFGSPDTPLPHPLDSPFWSSGNMILGGFDAQHRMVRMVGSNLAPLIETAEIQPFPGRRSHVRMARPVTDGAGATVATGYREGQTGAASFGPAVAQNMHGACPQFGSGRYVRFRLGMPAGTVYTHIQGVDTTDHEIFAGGVR
jgi:hypothetical protein